jgi:hypothetical protein
MADVSDKGRSWIEEDTMAIVPLLTVDPRHMAGLKYVGDMRHPHGKITSKVARPQNMPVLHYRAPKPLDVPVGAPVAQGALEKPAHSLHRPLIDARAIVKGDGVSAREESWELPATADSASSEQLGHLSAAGNPQRVN